MMQRKIYFAECLGRIKIGIANNVKVRLSTLRTGAGAPVTLIASVAGNTEIERALHHKLRAYKIDGEWYRDCPDVRAAIQNSLNNFPTAPDRAKGAPGQVPNWVWFARRCWPEKTAAHLAAIAGRDKRTAERWMSGEFDPPNTIMAALIAKMFERGF